MAAGPDRDADIVAVGSLSPAADGDQAELGTLVDDAWRGRGLGTILVERLALVAMRQGLGRLTAIVAATSVAPLLISNRVPVARAEYPSRSCR